MKQSTPQVNVARFTLAAFFLTLFGFLSLFQALTINDSRYLSISIASSIGLLVLVDRIRKHDEILMLSHSPMPKPKEDPTPAPKPLIKPEVQITHNGSNIIKYGQLAISRDNWQKLATAVVSNDNKLVRSIIPGDIFTNLTDEYPRIVKELKRLGWLDDNNNLTDSGLDWFSGFIPPTLADLSQKVLVSRQTTTTTENGRKG